MSRTPIRIVLPVIIFISAAMVPLGAEEEKPSRKARFLAVGNSPPYEQAVDGEIAREFEPPAGSVPPLKLAALDSAAKDGAASGKLELRLNRFTAPVAIPAGEGTIVLRKAGDAADSAPWLTVKRPESGDFLVLLWRKPGATNWDAPASCTLPDGPLGAPSGSITITNLFPAAVGIQWGGSYHVLKPGANHREQLAAGDLVPLRIDRADQAGKRMRFYSTTISRNENERTRIIIYRADDESPRRPLEVLMLPEQVEVATPIAEPK